MFIPYEVCLEEEKDEEEKEEEEESPGSLAEWQASAFPIPPHCTLAFTIPYYFVAILLYYYTILYFHTPHSVCL